MALFTNERNIKRIPLDLDEFVKPGESLFIRGSDTANKNVDTYMIRNLSKEYESDETSWTIYRIYLDNRNQITKSHSNIKEHLVRYYFSGNNEILDKETTEKMIEELEKIYNYQNYIHSFNRSYETYLRSSQQWW